MTHRVKSRLAPVALLAACALAIAGCTSTGPSTTPGAEVDPNAPVTISVGGKPTSESPEELAAFNRKLAEFTAAHPNITVNAEETLWQADTFQALLAGGQLPTVFQVPFTEMQGLIARQQVADVTDYVADQPALSSVNPAAAAVTKSAEGRTYGVTINAYTMGLLYNRALFTQAGLDPDSPPKTWDEVRTAAQAIDAKTDAQGFATMTSGNTGGWALTTMSYAFGSTMQSEDGKTATVANDATKKALEFYTTLRWQDNTMGSNFLIGYDDAVNEFSAGKIGMFVQGADAYNLMVINRGMDKEAFGVAPLPQADGGLGTLGGGTVSIVSPTATPEEITAAVTWIGFQSFQQFTDEAAAKADAKAAAADGLAVGAPGLPVLNAEANERYLGWVAEYINVPRENYQAYLSTVDTVTLVPEPPTKAQELYASLDPVVQAVLTRQDADVNQLLDKAQKTIQSAIDAG